MVVSSFGDYFPELRAKEALIKSVVSEEEAAFSSMLGRGVKYLNELVQDKPDGGVVAGIDAFFLYDSLGFPLDLTQLMAEEKGFRVDLEGFESAMEEQKQRSRAATQASKMVIAQPLNTH